MVSLATATPHQEKPSRDSRFSSRKNFDDWLASLPLANVSAAGSELLSGVQELNHARVSARFRLHALEQLIEPCLAVVNVLDKQYQDAAFPLDDKTDKIGRTVTHFFRELGIGYRLAAHQFAGETARLSMLHKRAGGTCVHRALACCEQLLYRCSLLFRPLPTGSWNEMHTLFAFATQNGLDGRSMTNPLGWQTHSHRVVDIYKRILLLGLCDPRRLSQRAMTQVFRACELWSERTRIEAGTARVGEFAIQVDSDYAPLLVQEPDQGSDCDFRFDLRPLKEWLQGIVDADQDSGRDVPFKAEGQQTLILDGLLLKQLTATWGVRVSRRHTRLPAAYKARVVIGINGVHFMAAGDQSFSQFLEETGNDRFVQQAGSINNWVAGSDQRFRPPIHEAQILNQSLGGYCLKFLKPEAMHLRVGELVAISNAAIGERDALWMIGAVRWIQAPNPEELEVGLSIIGQDFLPAAVMADVPGRRVPPARAVIVHGFAADDTETRYILVPPFHADSDSRWNLCWREDMQMHECSIQPQGLADRTTEFSKFAYSEHALDLSAVADLSVGSPDPGFELSPRDE